MTDRTASPELMALCTCCGYRNARISVALPATGFPLGRLRRDRGAVAVCTRCDLQPSSTPGWTERLDD